MSHIIKFRLTELKQSRSYLAVTVLVIAAIFFSLDVYIDVIVDGEGF